MAGGGRPLTGDIVGLAAISGISRSGGIMKRRPSTSHTSKRPVHSRAASAGVFAGAAAAALIAGCPVSVTVTLSPEPRTVVVSQDDVQHPVCQATLTR